MDGGERGEGRGESCLLLWGMASWAEAAVPWDRANRKVCSRITVNLEDPAAPARRYHPTGLV